MNVGAVCTVVVSAFAARKLVNILQVIGAGFPGIPHHHLTVLVPESDCGRVCAFSHHGLILSPPNRLANSAVSRTDSDTASV
jgi:hypothetical protein